MNIAVDAMGGDYAPEAAIQGALWEHSELGVEITCGTIRRSRVGCLN